LPPLYSISEILSMAAQEWSTGIELLAITDPTIENKNLPKHEMFVAGIFTQISRVSDPDPR
jgi:hypothetical protein